jgi:hypothetical protein
MVLPPAAPNPGGCRPGKPLPARRRSAGPRADQRIAKEIGPFRFNIPQAQRHRATGRAAAKTAGAHPSKLRHQKVAELVQQHTGEEQQRKQPTSDGRAARQHQKDQLDLAVQPALERKGVAPAPAGATPGLPNTEDADPCLSLPLRTAVYFTRAAAALTMATEFSRFQAGAAHQRAIDIGLAKNSAAFLAVTEPPYWMRTASATSTPNISFSAGRMNSAKTAFAPSAKPLARCQSPRPARMRSPAA